MADQNQIEKKEQAKPLSLSSNPLSSDFDENDNKINVVRQQRRRRRNYIKLCGCVLAIVVLSAMVLITLAFTVFHVRDPIVTLNSVTVANGDLTATMKNSAIVTLVAEFAVRNPNVASFRYGNASTAIFYDGKSVGKGQIPSGIARARRTVRTSVTVEILAGKVLESPRLTGDLRSGSLTMESLSEIKGRVRIANIYKRKVKVKLNCTISYVIASRRIQNQGCLSDVYM